MLAVDLDHDGLSEIVTRGDAQVRLLVRSGERWSGTRVASLCHDLLAWKTAPEHDPAVLLACDGGAQVIRR
jgi:hypothetical protein